MITIATRAAAAYAEFTAALEGNPAALELAAAADLEGREWYDLDAAALALVTEACLVLQSYESPEWGNVGGRYGVTLGAGGLTEAELDALASVDATTTDVTADPQFELLELDGWDAHALSVYARHCAAHGEAALVALADALVDVAARREGQGRA